MKAESSVRPELVWNTDEDFRNARSDAWPDPLMPCEQAMVMVEVTGDIGTARTQALDNAESDPQLESYWLRAESFLASVAEA